MNCHADAITPGCPVDCLKAVLSRMAFNPLARAYRAPFEPPRTVGDVVELYRRGQLDQIHGLGAAASARSRPASLSPDSPAATPTRRHHHHRRRTARRDPVYGYRRLCRAGVLVTGSAIACYLSRHHHDGLGSGTMAGAGMR